MSNSGDEHFECRVYTNWMNCKGAASQTDDINFMACDVTIRARIAGRVTPSTTTANCLDVIEIPTIGTLIFTIHFNLRHFNLFWFVLMFFSFFLWAVRSYEQNHSSAAVKLAVCQRMGTVLCAKDRFIKIFKLHECVNEQTHRFKYIDFIELPIEIEMDFVPTQLNIVEHIVGCANAEFMCVFKICEQNFYNTANSLTNTSSSELSVMATMPMCTFADQSAESMLDYGQISKKFLASITSNISSTFDYCQTTENGGDRMGRSFGRDRSIELQPNFVDRSIPMCNLRHFTMMNDDEVR